MMTDFNVGEQERRISIRLVTFASVLVMLFTVLPFIVCQSHL